MRWTRRRSVVAALVGLGLAGWTIFAFLTSVTNPSVREAGGLKIYLYPTLTGAPRTGDNNFEIKVLDREGRPVDGASVNVRYTMTGMSGMEARTLGARAVTQGIYETTLSLSMAGTWEVGVTVERPGVAPVTVSFPVQVQ
ncbi:MAG: FixH family protein [Deltaproteobacteria bacterium]|nr:FixH family protein [Deltaproteobacteria bacterium]